MNQFPNILTKSCESFILKFFIFLSILQILAFARGVIVVLEILMIVPVAKLFYSKKLRIFITDCYVSAKKLASSTYLISEKKR